MGLTKWHCLSQLRLQADCSTSAYLLEVVAPSEMAARELPTRRLDLTLNGNRLTDWTSRAAGGRFGLEQGVSWHRQVNASRSNEW